MQLDSRAKLPGQHSDEVQVREVRPNPESNKMATSILLTKLSLVLMLLLLSEGQYEFHSLGTLCVSGSHILFSGPHVVSSL